MSRRADVVVPVEHGLATARACLDSVYRLSGQALGNVIAVCDPGPEAALLRGMQEEHPDLVVLANETALGPVASSNRGLFLRQRDVVLLDSGVLVTPGWLAELLEVLYGSDRIASVAPLCRERARPAARFSDLPTAAGPCLLLRHWVLDVIGAFDPALARIDDAQNDWAVRAQCFGLRHVRANRSVVVAAGGAPPPSDDAAQVLYRPERIEDARDLLELLESPRPLVLRIDELRSQTAPLLYAAAHSAQALVVPSQELRSELVAELGLHAAAIEVVPPPIEAGRLASVFRRAVDSPSEGSLRYRQLMADFLRANATGRFLASGAAGPRRPSSRSTP